MHARQRCMLSMMWDDVRRWHDYTVERGDPSAEPPRVTGQFPGGFTVRTSLSSGARTWPTPHAGHPSSAVCTHGPYLQAPSRAARRGDQVAALAAGGRDGRPSKCTSRPVVPHRLYTDTVDSQYVAHLKTTAQIANWRAKGAMQEMCKTLAREMYKMFKERLETLPPPCQCAGRD